MKSVLSAARAMVVAICLLTVARGAQAQETINQASVGGRVVDQQGMVVPGAAVTARQTETNLVIDTTTDSDGRFRFGYMKLGPWTLTVSLPGFVTVTRSLALGVGSAFDLPLVMSVAGLDSRVEVIGEVPVIDAARSQIAGTIPQEEVRSLPMNGRNFLDLALLIPGVSPTNTASTQLFAETSAVPGQGISIGSQRNLSNNFIVDGLSANDDAAGLSGIPYTVDAVDQFQVVTSGGQAELGRALGGYVNVVTKSGTNASHGDVYGYFRDDSLNGRNALTGTRLPMSQQQYGLSLGGPVFRDRTFYFANLEQRRLHQTGLATIAQTAVDVINARLAAVGYPGTPVATGLYPSPVSSTNVMGKVDHQLSGRDQLVVRYSLYDVASSNSRGAGGLNAPSASAALDNRDQTLAVSNTWTLSPRTVNETRAQFAHSDLAAPSTDRVGPAVSISGVATFGTLSGSPQGRLNRMFQVVDSLSHQRGAHALRAGVDVLVNSDTINYPRSYRGAYTFSSLATFLSGTYNNSGFTQTFGVADIHQRNPNLGVYAQDEWKAGGALTVNLGLRYDLQLLETIRTDANNVSPRLGLAWAPAGRATVVRGGLGLYFDRVPLRALANALLSANNTTDLANLQQVSISLSPAQAGAPTFPNILAAPVPSVTLVNLTTMDRHLQNAHSRQASVEIDHQLGRRLTVSAGYQYVKGIGLLMAINQNVPACVASGTNNGCRPVASYANNSQYSAAGASNYHGLHLSLLQRPSAWGSYRVSYTLSSSKNNVGEFFFSSPIDPFDVSRDWGRSDDDQRHRLVVNGSLQTPLSPARTAWQVLTHGFQLAGMVQAYSALPFNITSGVTTIQGTAGRPLVNGQFIERNAGAGSAYLSMNLRLSRGFVLGRDARFEAAIEAFNVTNRRNDVTRNTNFGAGAYPSSPSPTFNQITAVADPRALQFAVRVRF
ncbi:MAG TPA: TonB-dependent receptor [Vicinamibacterales bacterium]|nr:TonB-dependent receptor [Vicinamibacterales bacterium]